MQSGWDMKRIPVVHCPAAPYFTNPIFCAQLSKGAGMIWQPANGELRGSSRTLSDHFERIRLRVVTTAALMESWEPLTAIALGLVKAFLTEHMSPHRTKGWFSFFYIQYMSLGSTYTTASQLCSCLIQFIVYDFPVLQSGSTSLSLSHHGHRPVVFMLLFCQFEWLYL